MRSRRFVALTFIAALAVLPACTPEPDDGPGDAPATDTAAPVEPAETDTATATPGETTEATTEAPNAGSIGEPDVVVTELEAPWSVAFHGEVPLISERDTARILELDEDGQAREVGTVPGVEPVGEGGLLGIAVLEEQLYAYSTGDGENRIHRFELTGEAGALELGEAEVVLDDIPAAGNHNGGRIAFGPDGMLYATTGDAGEPELSQDVNSLAGKILRMTPDGERPEDNPLPDSLTYSYGHRNSQGIAWGPDGTLYATEFGQDTWDELNVIQPGGNYGWPEVEGMGGGIGIIDPVQQWEPAEASPSGIEVAGESVWIANLRGERLREVPLDELGSSTEHWVGEYGRLRDVVLTPDEDLWVLTNNTDGRGSPAPEDDRVLGVALD